MDKLAELIAYIEVSVRRYLEVSEKIWTYEGPPDSRYPHALLTAGPHSNGYVDVGNLLKQNPQTRENISRFMLEVLSEVWQGHFTRVVGADTSSTALAHEIASIYGVDYIRMVKTTTGDQVWNPGNKPLTDEDLILQVEDLITTGESSLKVRETIRAQHPGRHIQFVPFLPVVVDRSDPDNRVTMIDDSKVLPLLKLNIKTFQPDNCDYCRAGSEAIRPRESNNWNRLTRKI